MKVYALSRNLEKLIENSNAHLSIGDFVRATGDKAFGIVLLVLSLPSALPIPATGISTPLGLAMFLIACQMIAGRQTLWLPERIMKIKLSKSQSTKMINGLNWLLKRIEKLFHPRYSWIHRRSGHLFLGCMIAGLSVVMQIPIPLTNTLPAAVIFCLALCLTEEDGLMGILASTLSVVVILVYIFSFTALIIWGVHGVEQALGIKLGI